MRSFTILAILAAVATADHVGTPAKPVSTPLSESCPLSECYVEPAAAGVPQKRGPPAIACGLGFSAVEVDSLPKGCNQRCKPCRFDTCTTVCQFEAYCDSGDCPDAMAKQMSERSDEPSASCPGGNKA
jgi:hypothetical protein